MIQTAFISGQLGKAIYIENQRPMVLDAADTGGPSRCTAHDWSVFFDSGAEYAVLPEKVKDVEELAGVLDRETRAHTALALILGSLDSDLAENRDLSIEATEELLQDHYVFTFVKRRLMARCLPEIADMDGARNAARTAGAGVLLAILDAVQDLQPVIEDVLYAWEQVAETHFAGAAQAGEAEVSLIELGIFEEMVSALAKGRPEDVNALIIKFGVDRTVSGSVPRVTHLLKAMKALLASPIAPDANERPLQEESSESRGRRGVSVPGFEVDLNQRPRKAMPALQAKKRVDAQIDSITKAIREHRVSVAEDWLKDLIDFQVRHGKKQHLAMSLCNLATTAIASREFALAQMLVDRAAALDIEDPVIPTMRAEIFRAMGQFPKALKGFDEAMAQFPGNAVARTGRAEVLKAMGWFPEALKGFDEAMAQFPGNVVVQTGRAEVLKAMGRFSEALEGFDETIAQFPGNAVAQTGRAEVLKAMGRFSEALEGFAETIAQFPDNTVAKNGRAEVLKAMGRFSEALEGFDETIVQFPDNAVARTGRAEVLKAMGRFPEALEGFDETIAQFPSDAVARNGRAEMLKAMGRFPEALEGFAETIVQFPDNAVARNGRAEVLKAMGRFPEALEGYMETRSRFPYDEYALFGAASVLVLMDRHDEAKALLSQDASPASQHDWIRYQIFSMIDVKSGTNLDEAIRRLTRGAQDAPWPEIRRRFINSLAVAWIKRENYRDALQVLHHDIEVLDIVEKQKRLALISHSYAATGAPQEALKTLNGVTYLGDPNLTSLKGCLFDRYSLDGRPLGSANFAKLDLKISQHEVALAMA